MQDKFDPMAEGDLTSGARYTSLNRIDTQSSYSHEQGKIHEPLPVRGYRAQSDVDISIVNDGKALEAQLIAYLARLASIERTDKRMIAIAKTNIQQGCMWAYRSVFQPSEE